MVFQVFLGSRYSGYLKIDGFCAPRTWGIFLHIANTAAPVSGKATCQEGSDVRRSVN